MKVVRRAYRLSYTRKEAIRRRKPPVQLKTDYEHLVDKSYAKKRQRGSPNSYIEKIPVSTSGTATNKNKEQIDASTTNRTNLFAGLSAEAQKVIDNMSEAELDNVIRFYEQTKMPLGGILGLEDLPADNNFVPRWRFQLDNLY
jgi:hypothetical protein